MEKPDGGKGNGNIGGKQHSQIRGWSKNTCSKFNGKTTAAGKSPWQHMWRRKGELALQAKCNGNACGKAMAKIVATAKDWTRKWEIIGKKQTEKAHCMAT